MSKKIIRTEKAPLPIGPYNQAIVANNLVYTSGQIALDAKTGNAVDAGISEQTRIVLTQLKTILEEAGSSLENVIKTTVFLKDMNDFVAMNAVYSEFFQAQTAPARSTIQIARLPKDVLVEIEAVAAVK
jgi:2-iminobutanoate/2-iminopropanoate deaminase